MNIELPQLKSKLCSSSRVSLRQGFYFSLSGLLVVVGVSTMILTQTEFGSIERSDPRVCSVQGATEPSVLKDAADALRKLGHSLGGKKSCDGSCKALNNSVNKFRMLKRTSKVAKAEPHESDEIQKQNSSSKKWDWWESLWGGEEDEPTVSSGTSTRSGSSTRGGTSTPKKPFYWGCEHRVRKDWLDLTHEEKELYFEGVNALKTTPRKGASDAGPGNNIYDTFVLIHGESANKKYAHQTAGFLSWHRKYLLEYEDAIRTVDTRFKCVTIPYWDWSSEMWECRKRSVKLDQPPCDTYHGASELLRDFGGPGDPRTVNQKTFGSSGSGRVGCVTTGPFANWVDHNGKCLSRGINWNLRDQKPFTGRSRLAEIVQMKEFGDQRGGFRVVLEGIPHGSTHNYLGGHMRSFISPADPIFFSHHCYIDKIWAVWQDCHDYDIKEVTAQLMEDGNKPGMHKYYKPTKTYDDDSITDPMMFRYPFGKEAMGGTPRCRKTSEECAKCVHPQDPWCEANKWDMLCRAQCVDHCSDVCSGNSRATMSLHVRGKELFDHWVLEEATPASMHSVHQLGKRSYTYAPDEFERHLDRHAPELLGGCLLDTHKAIQKVHGVLMEVSRMHHDGMPRGDAVHAYALMAQQAFTTTRKEMRTTTRRLNEMKAHEEVILKESIRKLQEWECKDMAGSCGDYKKEYSCKVDQPRFWLPWFGRESWNHVMGDPELKAKVFQDPCCAGEDLSPGQADSFLDCKPIQTGPQTGQCCCCKIDRIAKRDDSGASCGEHDGCEVHPCSDVLVEGSEGDMDAFLSSDSSESSNPGHKTMVPVVPKGQPSQDRFVRPAHRDHSL